MSTDARQVSSPLSPSLVFWFVVTGGLLIAVALPTVLALEHRWSSDSTYSHGYLIPLISLWLAWRYLNQAGWPKGGEASLGGLYLTAGVMFHFAALILALPLVDFLGLALLLRGVAVMLGGRAWASGLWFPILFLFFMFPIPESWAAQIAVWLQGIVSTLSGKCLELLFVTRQQGNAIHIAGVEGTLHVAEECSGLRQIVTFLAIGALAGHLSGGHWWRRVVLLTVAIPVAILANIFRVVLMAVGARYFGTEWLDGPLHYAPAYFTIPMGLLLYWLVWRAVRPAEVPPMTGQQT